MPKSKFLRWLIVFSLIWIGVIFAFITGLIDQVHRADVTKLSFVILGLFLYYTILIGLSVCEDKLVPGLYQNCSFISNIFLSIGMLGTVIGFIYMLSISFGSLGMTDTASMRMALQTMGKGMGTALWTTAAGLTCNLLLRLQLYLFVDNGNNG